MTVPPQAAPRGSEGGARRARRGRAPGRLAAGRRRAAPRRARSASSLQGIVLGTANGLLAIGLILIYRTNRIVNFAYGSLGSVAGLFGVQLYLKSGWNYFAAMGVAVVLGLVLGGIVEFLVIRRFARSSRLVLTVATIGLAQVLGGMELLLPTLFGGQGGPLGGFASPIHDRRARRSSRSSSPATTS